MDEIDIQINSIYDNPFTYFTDQISKTELYLIQNNITYNIPHYKDLEDKLFEYISRIPSIDDLQRKRFKKEMLKFLKERFELNEFSYSSHLEFQIKIETLFNQYITGVFDCSVELFTFCEDDSKKSSENLKTFFNYLRHIKESNLSAYIKDNLQLNYSLPRFLLINHSKQIKQRIITLWRMNNIHSSNALWNLNDNQYYKFLYEQYRDFFDGKSNLFDEKFVNKDTLTLLFQALFYANAERLKYKSNLTTFLQNSRKYLDLMGFDRQLHSTMVAKCYDFIQKNGLDLIDAQLIDIFTELNKNIGLSQDGKLNNTIMYIIFCCSCVMNNVIKADLDSKMKVVFVSTLSCSAKERQFLLNFLIKYDTFIQSVSNKCVYINSFIEKHVLSALFKSYTKVLYDQQNTTKISLSYQRVIDLLNQNNIKKSNDNNNNNDEIPNGEYIFSPLNEIEQEQFAQFFASFKDSIKEKEEKPESPQSNKKIMGLFSKLGTKITKKIQTMNKPFMKNKQTPILYPTDPFCVSIHICICISGVFLYDATEINDSSIWFNIINKNQNMDYYVFDWQNEDNIVKSGKNIVKNIITMVKSSVIENASEVTQVKENKRVSKKFGKFLAYIIASRSVFKFHTISLMGFALGCNVIKYCLKELNKINVNIEVSDVLYNVILLGGATTFNEKHKELFSIVSGNVYNYYSRCDNKLSFYYTENAVGCKELSYEDNKETTQEDKYNEDNAYPKFINTDLTSSKFEQSAYAIRLNKLLKNIMIQ